MKGLKPLVSKKSNLCNCYKEFGFERFTVSLAEVCLHETVNKESETNKWTFEFEIKQSNIMINLNKESTNHWTLEQ